MDWLIPRRNTNNQHDNGNCCRHTQYESWREGLLQLSLTPRIITVITALLPMVSVIWASLILIKELVRTKRQMSTTNKNRKVPRTVLPMKVVTFPIWPKLKKDIFKALMKDGLSIYDGKSIALKFDDNLASCFSILLLATLLIHRPSTNAWRKSVSMSIIEQFQDHYSFSRSCFRFLLPKSHEHYLSWERCSIQHGIINILWIMTCVFEFSKFKIFVGPNRSG